LVAGDGVTAGAEEGDSVATLPSPATNTFSLGFQDTKLTPLKVANLTDPIELGIVVRPVLEEGGRESNSTNSTVKQTDFLITKVHTHTHTAHTHTQTQTQTQTQSQTQTQTHTHAHKRKHTHTHRRTQHTNTHTHTPTHTQCSYWDAATKTLRSDG
jgi:hypothetical protein